MKSYIRKHSIDQRGECMDSNPEYITYNNTFNYSLLKKTFLFLFLMTAIFLAFSQGAYAMDLNAYWDAADTDTKIKLEWSAVPGVSTYQIQRDSLQDNSGPVVVATIGNNVKDPLSYIDNGLPPQTTYRYTITAFSGSGLVLDQKAAIAATTPMIMPYNLRAVYDINSKVLTLTWNASTHATGTRIFYTINGVNYPSTTSETTTHSIFIGDLTPVSFSVQSTHAGLTDSPVSNPVAVAPINPPYINVSSSNGTATVSWYPIPQISQFQLERSSWNGTTWDGWIAVNANLSGSSATDTPTSGGQYRYRLSGKPGGSYSGFSNISGALSGLPAPSSLTLAVSSPGAIDLSWVNGAGNTANIQVLRKLTDGSFAQIAMLGSTATSYTDTITVTQGAIYTYRVRSYESATSYSAAAEASTSTSIPAAPSSLVANVVSPTAITLTWTDNSSNETGFRLERLTDSGLYTEIAAFPAGTTTCDDTTVTSGHTYIYRIRAYNLLGNSAYSNEATVSGWDAIAPATLFVTPVSSTRLDLSWSYTGTDSYNTIIERRTGTDGTWSIIYTTANGVLKYSDTGLSPNTRYFYRIRKSMGTGSSGSPFPNDGIGRGAYTLLGNLSLSGSASSSNSIYLSWSGNTGMADVIVERKMSNGAFSALTTVSYLNNGWYDTTGLVPSAAYTYRIKARTSTNESIYSNEVTVQNLFLEPPSQLTLTVTTNSAIELNWKDNSTDETGFEIWRYINGSGNYTLFATVNKNVTTYTDKTVQMGVQYSYMVRGYVASGSLYSPYSSSATVGIGLINPPSNLNYTYVSSSQVLLRWTDTSDNENGFKVERKIGADGTWNIIVWLGSDVTAYDATGLNPYTKYYFRVRAYSSDGNSDSLSNEILVSTAAPAAPSDVVASALSSSQIRITWKDNSDSEDGFKILRKPANGYYYETLADVGKNITIYTDSNLIAGMKYSYKVASYNTTGTSESGASDAKTNTKSTFTDLGKSAAWAKDAIENLAGMGIMKGVTPKLYKPDNTLTKAEFTAMVVRAFKFDTATIGNLADVKTNKWYYNEVMIAQNFGLISGDKNNKFYPEKAITREEIACILFKAMEAAGKQLVIHDNSALEKFSDKNKITPEAMASMATVVGEGILEGLPGNAIGPQKTATRAQAAVLLYRAMNK